MKKTLLQMVLTCMVLGAVFLANDATLARESLRTKSEAEVAAELRDGAVTVSGANDAVKLPIIMYHGVLKDKARAGEYVISPVTLAADLDYLKSRGYEAVDVADLVRYTDGLGDLPAKPVMITFDDGNFNNYQYAYPLLEEREMKAVISVIGAETEHFSESALENPYWSYLTLDRLLEMQKSGIFEIQNHSYDLHGMAARRGCLRMRGEDVMSYRTLLLKDTEKTQELLLAAGVPAPTAYVYPFGMYSQETEEIIRSLGFVATMTCEERVNTVRRDQESLYRLGRFNRPAGVSTQQFLGKILGE